MLSNTGLALRIVPGTFVRRVQIVPPGTGLVPGTSSNGECTTIVAIQCQYSSNQARTDPAPYNCTGTGPCTIVHVLGTIVPGSQVPG